MMNKRPLAFQMFGCLALAVVGLPTVSLAQNQGGGGGRGMMGGGPLVGIVEARQILSEMNLTGDEKTKVDGMLEKVTTDMRDARQGMQDATPEERRQKMQDLQKEASDTIEKIQGELTPDQKEKFATQYATGMVGRYTDMMQAIEKAAAKLDVGDDQKKQVTNLLGDTTKTLDGYKTDSAKIKDFSAATDMLSKAAKTVADTRKQLVDILGQDDAMQLMRSVAQAMGGAGNRRGGVNPPATQPK